MKNFFIDKIWVSPEEPRSGYILWINPDSSEISVCLDDEKHPSHAEVEWTPISSGGGSSTGSGEGLSKEDVQTMIDEAKQALESAMSEGDEAVKEAVAEACKGNIDAAVEAIKEELTKYVTYDDVDAKIDEVVSAASSAKESAVSELQSTIDDIKDGLDDKISSAKEEAVSELSGVIVASIQEAADNAAKSVISEIVGGADADHDTLGEIADLFSSLSGKEFYTKDEVEELVSSLVSQLSVLEEKVVALETAQN